MTALELAHRYLELIYTVRDYRELLQVLHDDLEFRGPFQSYHSAKGYIQALIDDPFTKVTYQVFHSYENDSSACLIYKFNKHEISTTMVQIFELREHKISRIQLIFDTNAFKENSKYLTRDIE